MVQSATALAWRVGRIDTARRALVYLACTQRPGRQLRAELLDRRNAILDRHSARRGGVPDHPRLAPLEVEWSGKLRCLSLSSRMPLRFSSGLRRSRSRSAGRRIQGYSPSTLAAVIAGLVCAADIARAYSGTRSWQASLRPTRTGSRAISTAGPRRPKACCIPDVKYHYMRINVRRPSASRSTTTGCSPATFTSRTGQPDEKYDFEAREVIDAGFLELVRYGIRRADDPLIVDSLKVVDKVPEDRDAVWRFLAALQPRRLRPAERWRPVRALGSGPRMAACWAESARTTNSPRVNDVDSFITAFEKFSPSEACCRNRSGTTPICRPKGLYLGRSAGSAQPLVWAHSEYVKLLRSKSDGRVFDTDLCGRGALRQARSRSAPLPP